MKTASQIFAFYRHGFRTMQTGRTLWLIIIIKLVIIFGLLKFVFYPDLLQSRFGSDVERAAYVLDHITTWPAEQNGRKGL